MKNKIFFLIPIALFLFLRFSCEDVVDVTEDFWLEQDFTVKSPLTSFDEDYVIDALAASSLIETYKDNIKSIKVSEVTYELTYFSGSATQQINSGVLKVADPDWVSEETIADITNQNLQDLVGNEQSLTIQQAGVDKLAELIKNSPHKAVLILAGDANEAPLDFVVKFRFKVTMVASPL